MAKRAVRRQVQLLGVAVEFLLRRRRGRLFEIGGQAREERDEQDEDKAEADDRADFADHYV
jgi:hypothetical protein